MGRGLARTGGICADCPSFKVAMIRGNNLIWGLRGKCRRSNTRLNQRQYNKQPKTYVETCVRHIFKFIFACPIQHDYELGREDKINKKYMTYDLGFSCINRER